MSWEIEIVKADVCIGKAKNEINGSGIIPPDLIEPDKTIILHELKKAATHIKSAIEQLKDDKK